MQNYFLAKLTPVDSWHRILKVTTLTQKHIFRVAVLPYFLSQCHTIATIDRELSYIARFIYVSEIKNSGPFKKWAYLWGGRY